jgi:hypothetical protein
MRSATLGGRSRCSPVGRCPRATPAMCRERRVLEVVHTVFSRGVTVTTGLVVSRGWALTHVTSSTTTDPNSEHQGLHLLAVPLLGRGGGCHCRPRTRLRSTAYATEHFSFGRRLTMWRPPNPALCVWLSLACRGRSRRQPVPMHARRGDPRRSARDARPRLTRRVTPPPSTLGAADRSPWDRSYGRGPRVRTQPPIGGGRAGAPLERCSTR